MVFSEFEREVVILLKKRGRMRYTEIYREVGISQQGLTKLLKRFVRKGYLIREVDKSSSPPSVYYRLNPEKEDEIAEILKKEVEERYMILANNDLKSAEKLLHDVKAIIEKRKMSILS
jgi:DNA-binding HxlR family transcriptional regulator